MAKGRPTGANAKYTAAKTCIEEQYELLKWSNKHINTAKEVIIELMTDKDTQASVRKGCANTVIEMHQKFAKTYGKGEIVPEDFIEEKNKKKEPKGSKQEANGLLRLTYDEDIAKEG